MALKRSLWVGIPVLAAAALAVALLPPRPLSDKPGLGASLFGMGWYGGWFFYQGGRPYRTILERDAQAATTLLRARVAQARRGDSLIALAKHASTALRSPDGLVTVLYEPPFPADTARRILGTAMRELALYPRGEGRGMSVLVAVYADSARHPDLWRVWWRRSFFVRAGAQGSACIVELNRTPRGQRYDPRTGGWPLNGCAVYARFGPRGVRVDAGTPQDAGFLESAYGWQSTLTDLLVQARRQGPARPAGWEWYPRWAPILLDTSRANQVPPFQWRWSACLEGSDSSCLAAAGLSGRQESFWRSWYTNPFQGGSLVASLLASGDVRRFEAFWRADLPYPQALERAYGKPVASLVREVALRQWRRSPHGPHITTRVVSAAVGWLVVALGLAVVAGRRRQARS